MKAKELGRRRLLQEGAALAGLTAGAIRSASGQTRGSETAVASPKDPRAYGERSRFETSLRTPSGAQLYSFALPNSLAPLQDSMGIVTPSALHFVNNHGYPTPDIDPRQHRLLIHGLVDRPLTFTVEELKRLPSVSRFHFVECAGNSSPRHRRRTKFAAAIQQLHGRSCCSEWTGVLLSLLLGEVGAQKGARWLVAEGAEQGKLTASIPLEKAMEDALVVYGQNGEAVRPDNGYPLRLLVPGWEGMRNIKWLRRIKLVEQPYMAKYESTGYPSLRPDGKARWYQFEMGPKSLITFPSDAHRLPGRAFYQITGLAWSGGGAIRRVEVSTDGGRSWKEAQLQEPVHRIAHSRFRFDWTWDGEEAVLQSRSTDDLGQVQPTLAEMSKIWGVNLDYWRTTTSFVNHFNPIQPWKVSRDGSIEDALL